MAVIHKEIVRIKEEVNKLYISVIHTKWKNNIFKLISKNPLSNLYVPYTSKHIDISVLAKI